jgi:phage shock protein A
MPRGVKGSGTKTQPRKTRRKRVGADYAAQIADMEQEIAAYKAKISEIQQGIKELEAIKNNEDANVLLQAVLSSGISIEEAISQFARQ